MHISKTFLKKLSLKAEKMLTVVALEIYTVVIINHLKGNPRWWREGRLPILALSCREKTAD